MWFKVDDKFHEHRKIRRLGKDKAPAVGVWTLCGAWAADHLTDGFVPDEIVDRHDPGHLYAERLVRVGLWFRAEHQGEEGYQFHEWDEHQPTREQVLDRRRKRSEAGRLGGLRSAQARSRRQASGEASGEASASGLLEQVVKQNGSKVEPRPDPTRPDHKEHHVGDESPPRDDIERICNHLADRIEANGSKRPTITKRWRDAARLMLDKDGRTEEQIHRAIDWCQDDTFWRANILSLPKLRDKFDQLRLQATRDQSRGEARAVGWQALKHPPEFAARAIGAQLRALPPGGEWG